MCRHDNSRNAENNIVFTSKLSWMNGDVGVELAYSYPKRGLHHQHRFSSLGWLKFERSDHVVRSDVAVVCGLPRVVLFNAGQMPVAPLSI